MRKESARLPHAFPGKVAAQRQLDKPGSLAPLFLLRIPALVSQHRFQLLSQQSYKLLTDQLFSIQS